MPGCNDVTYLTILRKHLFKAKQDFPLKRYVNAILYNLESGSCLLSVVAVCSGVVTVWCAGTGLRDPRSVGDHTQQTRLDQTKSITDKTAQDDNTANRSDSTRLD